MLTEPCAFFVLLNKNVRARLDALTLNESEVVPEIRLFTQILCVGVRIKQRCIECSDTKDTQG